MKVEWQYLVVLASAVILAVFEWQRQQFDDIHTLFCIGGAILSLIVLTAFPIQIGKMNVSNFMTQMALLNIILGLPAIRGLPPPTITAPPPHILFIGTTTEEIFRIASFQMVVEAYAMPNFAVFVSGIVFAAMHMYWYPTEWAFGIVGGMLFSLMLMKFGSPTACVVSHWMYDMLAFGLMPILPYFGISFFFLIIGQIPVLKRVEV